jgi:hypothetical protein
MLLAGLAGLVAAAALLDHSSFVATYSRRFDIRPGAIIGEGIARSNPSDRTCIVVGASTARQAFDPAILAAAIPSTRFLNAGTTGGTIEVLEIQARIIARHGLRYRCIIAGLHPWQLKNVQRPALVATEYISHLGPLGPLRLSGDWWKAEETWQVVLAMALPMRKHSGQLNRLARYLLYTAQHGVRTKPLPLDRFEVLKDDLQPYPDFGYAGNPKLYHERRADFEAALRRLSWLDPAVYLAPDTMRSFGSALGLLADHADRLFVVTLPDTPLWDGPNAWATRAYLSTIEGLHGRATHIDCRNTLSLDEFVDHAHPNDDGRRVISQAVGALLRSELASDGDARVTPVAAVRACVLGAVRNASMQ